MSNELVIKDLHVSVEGKPIIEGLNLTIKQGEIHALMGPIQTIYCVHLFPLPSSLSSYIVNSVFHLGTSFISHPCEQQTDLRDPNF